MPPTTAPTDHATPQYGGWSKNKLEDLDLPSGGLVQVRRPGMNGLVKAGIVEDLDTLTGIVATETIPTAEGSKPAKGTGPSTAQVLQAMEVMDRIVAYVVVQPPLTPTPAVEEDRDEDTLYVDDVPFEDKAFIVQYAMGGTRDLERFRAESSGAVGGVHPV